MADILPFSMCRTDFASMPPWPQTIRIPRPLRDLLRSSRDGLVPASRRAWTASSITPGEWVRPNVRHLLDGAQAVGVEGIALRQRDGHLHLQMAFRRGTATAIGRRLIVIVRSTSLAATIQSSIAGDPLSKLVSAPFLGDPSLTIQRLIQRSDAADLDIRCRCPSHVVDLAGREQGQS